MIPCDEVYTSSIFYPISRHPVSHYQTSVVMTYLRLCFNRNNNKGKENAKVTDTDKKIQNKKIQKKRRNRGNENERGVMRFIASIGVEKEGGKK